ncbi:MAG TPA: 30S ribosomal protein S12 methylthiotransferase RimO [Candidatus Anoxymicrobiaceae bacterium]
MKNKHFLIVTLGCFKNEVESDNMRCALEEIGLTETGDLKSADIVVVNTCGFIADACDEGIDTILELDALKSEVEDVPPILAVGCMVQRYGVDLIKEMPEISGVLGTDWQGHLAVAVSELLLGSRYSVPPGPPRPSALRRHIDSSDNATLFVRVADGCDRGCRFCSIPSIKGPFISRPPEDICEEVKRLSNGRDREVILLAQDLTSYGLDNGSSVTELAKRLTDIPEVRWLRLLYLQPEGVTPRLIEEIAGNPRICDYFDIPFQHASVPVLRAMGRPGGAEAFMDLVGSIRERIPDAAIRSTVMVGYPGETEEDFETLLEFITEARFDWLGAFIFSPEEGTTSISLPGAIDFDVAVSRYNMVAEAQDRIEESGLAKFEGHRLEVVIDSFSEIGPYEYVGRSYREAPVVDGIINLCKDGDRLVPVEPGRFLEALITGREGLDLVGEI